MVKAYNDFHIPSYHVLGNHDADKTPFEETVKAYNMPGDYYFFDVKGYRMVVCNPNFLKMNGEYLHYSMGNYYGHAEKRDHMPPEQLQWLEETIDEFNLKFKDKYIDNLCIILKQALDSGKTAEIMSSVQDQMTDMQDVINLQARTKADRKVFCVEVMIFVTAVVLGIGMAAISVISTIGL